MKAGGLHSPCDTHRLDLRCVTNKSDRQQLVQQTVDEFGEQSVVLIVGKNRQRRVGGWRRRVVIGQIAGEGVVVSLSVEGLLENRRFQFVVANGSC